MNEYIRNAREMLRRVTDPSEFIPIVPALPYPNPIDRLKPIPIRPPFRIPDDRLPIKKRKLKGKGRKGRRAYPDEDYSSSEDEMEGGAVGGPDVNSPQSILNEIDRLLNEGANTQAQARVVYRQIKGYLRILRRLIGERNYQYQYRLLLRQERYQQLFRLCGFSIEDSSSSEDELGGGNRERLTTSRIILDMIEKLENEVRSEPDEFNIPRNRLNRYIVRYRIILEQYERVTNNEGLTPEEEGQIEHEIGWLRTFFTPLLESGYGNTDYRSGGGPKTIHPRESVTKQVRAIQRAYGRPNFEDLPEGEQRAFAVRSIGILRQLRGLDYTTDRERERINHMILELNDYVSRVPDALKELQVYLQQISKARQAIDSGRTQVDYISVGEYLDDVRRKIEVLEEKYDNVEGAFADKVDEAYDNIDFLKSQLMEEGGVRSGGAMIQPINQKPEYMFGGMMRKYIDSELLPVFNR